MQHGIKTYVERSKPSAPAGECLQPVGDFCDTVHPLKAGFFCRGSCLSKEKGNQNEKRT